MTIGIAGAGPVAQALGRGLIERGVPVRQIASRSPERAVEAAAFIGGGAYPASYGELHCDRIVIAVSDRAIPEVAAQLPPPAIALHTCGAYGAAILDGLRSRGVACGSLHPLQTFATPMSGYRLLASSAFAIDGDPAAVAWARAIAGLLGGAVLEIDAGSRALYHAAAAMASNHLVSAIDAARLMLIEAGVPSDAALSALRPLAQASLDNAFEHGTTAALTGPVVRGDAATVRRHLDALSAMPHSVREFYRAAALHAVEIAHRRGVPRALEAERV